MPFRVTCATCGETLDRDQFSKSQLINKSDGQRRCRQCVVRVILVHEHSHAPPAAHVVLLDLENLAFLATSLQPFVFALQMHGVAYEAYAAQDNGQANRATVVVESSDKEAVDVKMVWDASRLARELPAVEARRAMRSPDDLTTTSNALPCLPMTPDDLPTM